MQKLTDERNKYNDLVAALAKRGVSLEETTGEDKEGEEDEEKKGEDEIKRMTVEAVKIKRNIIDFKFKVREINGRFLRVIEEELLNR